MNAVARADIVGAGGDQPAVHGVMAKAAFLSDSPGRVEGERTVRAGVQARPASAAGLFIQYNDIGDGLIASLSKIDLIRYAASERVPPELFAAAAQTGFNIARTTVVMAGRIERLQYYRQQSVCTTYHRYGNLGDRAVEFTGS
jgi:hypothetical protein